MEEKEINYMDSRRFRELSGNRTLNKAIEEIVYVNDEIEYQVTVIEHHYSDDDLDFVTGEETLKIRMFKSEDDAWKYWNSNRK